MSQAQILLNAIGGSAAAWLAVLFSKANALALRRARLAKVLSVAAGIIVAVTSTGFDSKLVADQTWTTLANAALALVFGHTSWKTWLQPQIEAGQGLAASLHQKTAGFGIG